MSVSEKLKDLNRERKEIKVKEKEDYCWENPDDYLKLKKKRKKIEKQIFNLIQKL